MSIFFFVVCSKYSIFVWYWVHMYVGILYACVHVCKLLYIFIFIQGGWLWTGPFLCFFTENRFFSHRVSCPFTPPSSTYLLHSPDPLLFPSYSFILKSYLNILYYVIIFILYYFGDAYLWEKQFSCLIFK